MFKSEFLNMLKAVDALHLPQGGYAITGSGPLVIRNVRAAHDVDVVVKQALWHELCKKYTSYDEHHIKIGDLEIWGDFLNLTPRLDEVIDVAEMIDGYPFVSLQDTLRWKAFLNRPKDQADILVIKRLLNLV